MLSVNMLWSTSSQHAPFGSSERMFSFFLPVSSSIVLSTNNPQFYITTAWKMDLHESNHWISHLKAQIRDDGRETICSQQWHHQLFQTLAHLVLLQEEKKITVSEEWNIFSNLIPENAYKLNFTSMRSQKRFKSCCISGCSSTDPPPSNILNRKFISTSSTKYTLH